MSAETLTYNALVGAAAVTAIVGAGASAKIYPDEAAQEAAPPLIVFERGDSDPEYTLDNTLAGNKVQIHVTSWAATRVAAEQLADACVTAMATAGYVSLARDGSFDAETQSYAAVVLFEVWEL
ncbi:MAG TPA: DUF3168 domain-containing protein [Burkholderiales bacterium]|nr:DUF3168 domain-containing protein [Burkholderiales bacterium]